MIGELTRAVRSRQAVNPRTVLGFYATVIGLVLVASALIVAALITSDEYGWLIPWILIFAGVLVVALVVGVFAVSLSDPSRLMLTQVTGSEYAEIQRFVVLGSSATGERLVPTTKERVSAEQVIPTLSASGEALEGGEI